MAIKQESTPTSKIDKVLAMLDGIEIIHCSMGTYHEKSSLSIGNEGGCGRYFENTSGNIYEACQAHLPIYLRNLRGGPEGGGWKEIIF